MLLQDNKHTKLLNSELYNWIKEWIEEESNSLLLGILATVNEKLKPCTRTIVIREIDENGLIFFTQKGSKKVKHMEIEDEISLTILLSKKTRQITFRGKAKSLSNDENIKYWKTYPKESQIRFIVYGPISGQVIADNSNLNLKLENYRKVYADFSPDKPEAYVGYRVLPDHINFYQLNNDTISDSFILDRENNEWEMSRVVP